MSKIKQYIIHKLNGYIDTDIENIKKQCHNAGYNQGYRHGYNNAISNVSDYLNVLTTTNYGKPRQEWIISIYRYIQRLNKSCNKNKL